MSDDTLEREEIQAIRDRFDGTAPAGSGDLFDDFRSLLAHDAALRERVEELEGALEHTLREIEDAVRRGIIPASAVNTWKAGQALEADDDRE